jgi:transcriptional regulator with XRE-family HTH domain
MSEKKTIKPLNKPRSVAEYIEWQVNLCGKPQKQIAEEAGFPKPNIITMFKQGSTTVPLEKIGKLAKALEVDAVHLLKLCLREYLPDTYAEIEKIFGQPVLTQNELDILEAVRASKVENPKIRTTEDRLKVIMAIDSLKPDNATN